MAQVDPLASPVQSEDYIGSSIVNSGNEVYIYLT